MQEFHPLTAARSRSSGHERPQATFGVQWEPSTWTESVTHYAPSYRRTRACLVALLLTVSAAAPGGQQPPDGKHARPGETPVAVPELPPGAVRLVSVARHGDRYAICAEGPGLAAEQGTRLIQRTRVWVHDGIETRQVGTAAGTCDPAWSADGQRVAVVAPDGLWVLTPDLRITTHLVATRHTESPGDEATHRTLTEPEWAPDGLHIAFKVSNNATSWVEAVDAGTGQSVYQSAPETYDFAWGADSTSLRFGSREVRLP
jgi:hypothetical protein